MKTLLKFGITSLSMISLSSLITVHADEATTPTLPDETASKTTSTSHQLTEQELAETIEKAKVKQNELLNEQTVQNNQVLTLTKQVEESKLQLDIAKQELTNAEQLLTQATPENIVAEESKLQDKKDQLAPAESKLEQAKEKVADAKQEVDTQAGIVSAQDKQVKTAEQAVKDAEQVVKQAEEILDNKGLQTLTTNISKLEATIETERLESSDLVAAFNIAQNNHNQLLQNGRTKLQELETALTASGPEYLTRVKKTELGRSEIDRSDFISSPTAEKPLVNENVTFDGERVEDIILTDRSQYNNYNKEIDYKKLSEFAREYLLELRRINGIDIPIGEVTDKALAWAKARAEEMNRKNYLSHASDLNISDYSLLDETENATSGAVSKDSRDEREIAYNQILDYFSDYRNAVAENNLNPMNYGHRTLLLGGVGTGFAMSGSTKGYGTMSFVSDNSQIEPHPYENFIAGTVKNEDGDPNRTEYYFNGKRIKFLPKITFRYILQENVLEKNATRVAALQALETFRTQQEQAEAISSATLARLSTDLNTKQTSLTNNETKLNSLKNQLQIFTADNTTKLNHLNAARQDLETKTSVLNQAKQILETESNKLAALNKVLKVAESNAEHAQTELGHVQTAIKEQEDYIYRLKNATTIVAASQTKLASVQNRYQQLTNQLNTAQTRLNNLNNRLKASNQSILQLTKRYENLVAKQETIVLKPTVSSAQPANTISNSNTLPKTSDDRQAALSTAGLALTLTSLGLVKGRKKQRD